MTAIELSKRSQGKINAYSLHPGVINTNLMHKGVVPEGLKQSALFDADEKPHDNDTFRWKTIPQGAATTITAAFDRSLNDKPGAYLDNSAVANETIAPHASDPASTEKLWSVTEKIIGETFTF
ncbi:hypothetical protein R3P38DRAFT_3173996 [Favolaschia claudopus]|uniref:Uncharacterized protein n=1 Tax=Favolaschia claudopus TaxID=2862362 RepID=A0AAW0DG86_9AGAR